MVYVDVINILLPIICGIAGLLIGAALIFFIPVFKKHRAETASKKIIRDAEVKAEHITKHAKLDGKQAAFEMKQEAEKEIKERRKGI